MRSEDDLANNTFNAANEWTNRRIAKAGTDKDEYAYTYDAVGNLTGESLTLTRGAGSANSVRGFVYDAFGRMVRSTGVVVEGEPTHVTRYRYNGLGMRIMWQDDADADTTLESSERFYICYDERWRPVGTFRDTDASPKEAFVYHAAGQGGFGGSSYIDSIILRDRDNYTSTTPNPMTSEADGTLEERRFYCQNWRADVVAITGADGVPLEYVRYSSYGEPIVYPVADLNMDGVVNSTDNSLWSDLLYVTPCAAVYADSDLDWDGVDDWYSSGTDSNLFLDSYNANVGLSGNGRVSSPGIGNRKGYAAYEWDQVTLANHVRFRVYFPEIGRWGRRDPAGYAEGSNLYSYCKLRSYFGLDPYGLVTTPSDPAKHPRVCCGATRTLDPFTHCEVTWGPCAAGETEHEVWTDRSPNRTLSDGTPCNTATREQISACLGVNPHSNHPIADKPYGLGNNCQKSVAMKIQDCCLLTSWQPSLHTGVDRPCAEWKTYPIIGRSCSRWAGLNAPCKTWANCGWHNSGSTGAPAVWGCDCVAWGTPGGPDLSLPEDPWPRPPRPTPAPRPPGIQLP